MKTFGKAALALATALAMVVPLTASAQDISDDVIKVGIMNDQSGPYADNCGPGSVVAANLAVEDHGGEINGKKIELVVADDQNKPDVGASIALKWLDSEGVDAIVGCSASSIALAVSKMMAKRNKPYMLSGTAGGFLTNEECTPVTTQWIQDTYALSKGTVQSMLDQGNKTFYFITVDYTFGKAWQEDATRFIEEGGGDVVGSVLHPLNTNDFSSYLLQAQASGADVIALANAGADLGNVIKQAAEFGIGDDEQTLAPLGMFINNAHSIGLVALEDVQFTAPFYWDRTEETRAFTERYRENFDGRFPNEAQASYYSALNHYLKSVEAAGTDDGGAVNARMREMPVNDFAMTDVNIREDGQVMRPVYAIRVKGPGESSGEYDYYDITGTLPPAEVFRPASESACPLLKAE